MVETEKYMTEFRRRKTLDFSGIKTFSAEKLAYSNGISYLEGGFTLRCLQRLSRPYIATRLCHWRDNRCTIGTSIPVLSY